MPSYRQTFAQFAPKFHAESHFLHIVLPSVVRPGEEFTLRAVMMDAAGMPDESFTGRVPIRASAPGLRVPKFIEFTPDGFGMATGEGLVAEQEGGYHVVAEPEGCPGRPPTSNAVLCRQCGPRLYWGDIHVHTVVGNCHPDLCKSPEFAYWYARHVALTDFCAVTDHLRGIHAKDGNWDRIRRAAREAHDPGRFVTFLAFESSHARGYGGDNNIYYNADEAGHFWVDREDMKGISPKVTLDELWAWLDAQGVPYISIPHHTGRAGKYRDFDDPYYNRERETVLEVYSWWGSSEARHDDLYLKGGKADRRAYWQDALELGYRYGVIASSDTHHTMPATPYPVTAENYAHAQHRFNCQGMAGIYANELERGRLFDALLGRQCFGTMWWRPVLEFSVCGVPMGCEAVADESLARRRRIEGTLAAPCRATVTLMRNNQPIARQPVEPGLARFALTDEEPLDTLWIRGAPKSPEPFVFYWLRVEAAGTSQLAWSSPVWLTASS